MALETLKVGDILHCSGNRVLSKLIKKFTKSKFSHTALFIEIWGQPYIIDAQKDGVNVRPFEEWKKEYNYNFIVHRPVNPIDEKEFSIRALSKVGHTAYDIEGLVFKHPWQILTGTWKEKGDKSEQMFCSEFVAWVYNVETSYRMSPQDVYEWCKENDFITVYNHGI